MKSLILAVLLSLLFITTETGCNRCSDVSPEATAPISFFVTDGNGKNLVQNGASTYHPDSVRLLDTDGKTEVIFQREFDASVGGYLFQADCARNNSGSSLLLLRLNKSDTDTLLVSYQVTESRCFTTYQYTRFEHNGVRVFPGGDRSAIPIVK